MATDYHWPAVVITSAREKTVWRRMSRILRRERATPQVSGFFFKAMIQAVMLFGEETWVITPLVGTALGVFHTQVKRRLTVQLPRRKTEGTWKYTLTAAAREAERFLDDGGIRQAVPEHSSTVYHCTITVRPV